MAEYKWPEAEKRRLIGKRISRVDGPLKVSGKAKYSFDMNRPGMLFGRILRSPYANAKVVSIDISQAEKMPGVKAVKIIQGAGSTILWAGDEIVAVAAVDEPTALDAMRAIKVEYERLPHVVNDANLATVPDSAKKPAQEKIQGEPDKALAEADVTVEGYYGNAVITHCCLESHGQTVEWTDENNVLIHPSTQGVSVIGNDLAKALEIPAGNVDLKMDFIGGGFGSKFSIDRWRSSREVFDRGGQCAVQFGGVEVDAGAVALAQRCSQRGQLPFNAGQDGFEFGVGRGHCGARSQGS